MLFHDPAGGRWSLRDGIRELQIGHAGFEQNVVQHILLGVGEIALGLFTEYRQRVDGLARAKNVSVRLLALGSHHAKLHHRGHVERGDEALKSHLKTLTLGWSFGASALAKQSVELLIGRAIVGVLSILLGLRRWRWRRCGFRSARELLL